MKTYFSPRAEMMHISSVDIIQVSFFEDFVGDVKGNMPTFWEGLPRE